MKMFGPIMLFSIVLGMFSGCGGASETVKIRIVNSKQSFVLSDSLNAAQFPPRGIVSGGNNELSNQISDRRFYKSDDTISVEKNAEQITMITPDYPNDARKRFMEGTVWVRLWITKEGNVRRAKVEESTDVIFNESALTAAMNCKYSPAMKEKMPVEVSIFQPFHFKLAQNN